MNDYNEIHTYPITVARGYAIDDMKNINEENIASFIQKADEAMYENKKRIKAGM